MNRQEIVGLGPKDEQRKGDWGCTVTGRQFYPLDPRPEDVCIEDIVHALANVCRFGGHVREYYSVAQHSVLVAWLVDDWFGSNAHSFTEQEARDLTMAALLHDGSDAYVGDMIRPLKVQPEMKMFRNAERAIMEVIAQVFHIDPALFDHWLIKWADNVALAMEAHALMPEESVKRWQHLAPRDDMPKYEVVGGISPTEARYEFMSYFRRLERVRDRLH